MIHQGKTSMVDRELTAREVTPADIGDLYRLRMDDATRHMFRNPDVVSFEDHERFVSKYLSKENSDCWFVLEVDSQVIGTMALCDLDREQGVCETGEVVQYQLVGQDESNVDKGRISVTSPLGKAIIGKKPGDEIALQTPGGRRCYELVEIL